MTMPTKSLIAAAWVVCISAQWAFADAPQTNTTAWRSWRGPSGNGSVEQGSYPVTFGAEKYLWRTELPGKGCSTPIVLDGKIYLTSPADGNDALLCYDLAGKEAWRAVLGKE